jgi:hypothetical protein
MTVTAATHSTWITRRGLFRSLVLLCPLALALTAVPARADNPLDFTLKNRLGVTIREVYVKPHQVQGWEEDVLGTSVLSDGRNVNIRFDDGQERRGDLWDLKVVTADGQTYTWTNPGFRLAQLREITVYLSQGRPMADSK